MVFISVPFSLPIRFWFYFCSSFSTDPFLSIYTFIVLCVCVCRRKKWFHVHRICLILEPDVQTSWGPLHGRSRGAKSDVYNCVECHQAFDSVSLLVQRYASFMLVHAHTYIRLIFAYVLCISVKHHLHHYQHCSHSMVLCKLICSLPRDFPCDKRLWYLVLISAIEINVWLIDVGFWFGLNSVPKLRLYSFLVRHGCSVVLSASLLISPWLYSTTIEVTNTVCCNVYSFNSYYIWLTYRNHFGNVLYSVLT